MAKKKKSPEKIYRHPRISRNLWLLFSLLSLCSVSGFGIFLIRIVMDSTFLGLIMWGGYTLIMMYIAFAGFWVSKESALHQKIIITDRGIWHYHFGKRFYPWEMVIKLELVESLFYSIWVLHTGKATIEYPDPVHKWLLASSWGYSKTFIPIPRMHRSIHNLEKFKETEFGQDLVHYAPHLFEGYDDWKPKNRMEDGYAEDSQSDWLEESKRG